MTSRWASRLSGEPVGSLLGPRLARTVLFVVLFGFGMAALLSDIGGVITTVDLVVVLTCLPAILVIQIGFFGRQMHVTHPRLVPAVVAAHFVLAWGPLLVIGVNWLGQPGFFAGTVLLTASLRIAVPTVAATALAVGGLFWYYTGDLTTALYGFNATLISALVIFGLTTLAGSVVELHRTRTALAAMAVRAERDRFARDLHDLLGYRLSAITLKSELASAVVTDDPERAKAELRGLSEISREALRDVRRVAHGGGDQSAEAAVEAAASLLRAAGIQVDQQVELPALRADLAATVAAVVREGVTNVLRHSIATVCRIEVTPDGDVLRMRIANNGVERTADGTAQPPGKGMRNMRDRLAAHGGAVVTAVEDGWFRMDAMVPLPGS